MHNHFNHKDSLEVLVKFHVAAIRWVIFSALALPLAAGTLFAQAGSGVLRGRVTDPSGAVVVKAVVSITSAQTGTKTAITNGQGRYEIRDVTAGTYSLTAVARGFALFRRENVIVSASRTENLNISLKIEQQAQQVTVSAEATQISVSPENNASAVVITGKALQALSNDPDELQEELSALAGPAAGPNGGQIYIDGFTGGQLPPKSDILAIHINQNPFSAQYDQVGYGRIEIITKPGSSQYHGSIFADGNDSVFNARNPFVTEEPSYHSEFINGNIGGPLGKKASFFFDTFHRGIDDSSIVNAFILNPNLEQTLFSQAVPNPQSRLMVTPRIDYQVSPKNVLTVRYQLWRDHGTNDGIGQFSLPSQAYNTNGMEHTLQVSDTQIVSDRTVNQTRFQFRYGTNNQIPQNLTPAINVLGGFTGGGSAAGKSGDTLQSYELHNVTTMSLGKQTIIFGGRVREWNDSSTSAANFNGTFTFPTLTAYQITEQGLAQGLTPDAIRAAGGGPNQFAISSGVPLAKISQADFSLYGEDQWRARQNLSLDVGLRFESQTNIRDHADFAPRVGFAWGLGHGRSPQWVLRGGFGLFYDRFMYQQVLEAERLNGVNQQQYLIANPNFYPSPPPVDQLSTLALATTPAVYSIDPALRAPYDVESALGLERQIGKNITMSVTYLNSHGVHQLLTRNINTPLPGTYDPANPAQGRPFANANACGVAPAIQDCGAGFAGNIFQFESDGLFNQNELITNFHVNEKFASLFGYYTLNYADSNTDGVGSMPSNPYDIMQDYGRAAFDVRNRFLVGGDFTLPYGFAIMPFFHVNSGRPYNITLGHDLIGSSAFNQRPAFALPGQTGPNILNTSLGDFNINPALGEALIPVNYGDGPGLVELNLRISKTFGFGGEKRGGGGGGFGGHWHHGGLGGRGLSGGGGGHGFWNSPENERFNLTFSVMAHNAFNTVNLGVPVGQLGSPLFGESNSLANGRFLGQAANRQVDFQMRFSF